MNADAVRKPIKPAQAGVTWLLGSVVLLSLMLLNILLVTIPFYGSGMHLMSNGQIYAANNLAGWYFLYYIDNFYLWSRIVLVLFKWVGIPLFCILSIASLGKWKTWSSPGKVAAIIVASLFLTLLFTDVASRKGIWAWLLD